MLLFAGPALTFGLCLIAPNLRQDPMVAVALCYIVTCALTPFAAASCFGAERETGLVRFWDFFPVSRLERYLAKWTALLVILIITFGFSLASAVLVALFL